MLVAPAGPLNVGSVARVMKNFGLTQLVLVNPQCDPLSAEALQMAVHAKDVLENAQRVETIPDALEGCSYAIATTARQRGFNAPLERPQAVLPTLLTSERSPSDTALIFGPEDRGLSNEELTYAQRFTKIPTDAAYSALNLAQAVAVCCYELYQATQPKPTELSSSSPVSTGVSSVTLPQNDGIVQAPINELEGYFQHLERVLLKVEYLYSHTAASRMRKFRQLLNRASPTSQEVAMLRGILRQTEWALSEKPPNESRVLSDHLSVDSPASEDSDLASDSNQD